MVPIQTIHAWFLFSFDALFSDGDDELSFDGEIPLLSTPSMTLKLANFFHAGTRGRLRSAYECRKSVLEDLRRENNTAKFLRRPWCLMAPDTGTIRCTSEFTAPAFRAGLASRHVHIVPRQCVEWKSEYKANRVYQTSITFEFSRENVTVKVTFNVNRVRVELLHFNHQRRVDEREFRWRKEFAFLLSDFGRLNSSGHDVNLEVDGEIRFRVARREAAFGRWHLELILDFLRPFWRHVVRYI